MTKAQAEYAAALLNLQPVIKVGKTRGYNKRALRKMRLHKDALDKSGMKDTVVHRRSGSSADQTDQQ